VTAGVIESEIRNNNKCDFDRYYGKDSAYHSIAGAIQKRMDVPAKVTFYTNFPRLSLLCTQIVFAQQA